ncbi:MAG: LacI family DNA-binding transcriptional regulator [Sphaerochaeta sp.]|nr:LacI family DNA-binding transcriptional regulator [Sphaerochaeta sp.]
MGSTIIDVARICGYSKTTVSRAFASPEMVSEKARDIIYSAAKQVNYTPDAIARAMVRKKTNNIGFIVNDQQYPVVLNPFYSPVFEGVLQVGRERGYSVFIASEKDIKLPTGQIYVKKQMDGVIICGQTEERIIEGFRSQNIPVVLLNNVFDLENLVCVTVDHYGGTIKAIEHLIAKGKRDIAIVSGHFSPYVFNERFRGYTDTLEKHGITLEKEYMKIVEPILVQAMDCAKELLALEHRPTAIFATNDIIAIGAIKVALRSKVSIPDEISIVGFDDSDYSEIIEPELTTVRIDKQEMGKIAAGKLIDILEGVQVEKQIIVCKTHLIERETT